MKLKKYLSLILTTVICIALFIYEPLIFNLNNLSNISKQASLIAIFALAQSIVLIARGLDLSQGGTICIISVTVALLCVKIGLPCAILVGVIVASLIGFFNGIIISSLGVSPFVVTLGTGFLLQGIALVLSNGQPVYKVTPDFTYLGWHEYMNIPLIVFILAIIVIILYIYLQKTIFGRFIFALGSNERAAFLTGIKVSKHKIIAYIICSVLTSLGAVILASRINSGHPVEGANTALQSVAAAVIGGVSLFGGKGTVLGVLLGSLLLAFLSNALNILNISSYYQQIMIGIIIIIAVVIDKLTTHKGHEKLH